ncbi:hypothetical protein M758_7G105200 [Ceratodon purpureus]|uniref:Uncharacterized protein n=1 Tax=Ceratodon purpureus TaxID=3225 RepID=A0A8T0H7K8_CERPU|nr:hypothetical protein KC19_7G171100 [Ceratodon purpureus]KAG0610972.1 hypothetical protein M758_7G105200 [Ceratodon purpureus]
MASLAAHHSRLCTDHRWGTTTTVADAASSSWKKRCEFSPPGWRRACHTGGISVGQHRGLNGSSLHRVVALAASGSNGESSETDTMLAEFMQYVDATQQLWPLEGRKPTALMPPTSVVRVQMDALMRNDWPEEDSGIKTAFAFAMPARVEEILSGKVRGPVNAARAWNATERYLNLEAFGNVIRDPMYSPLLNFSEWEMASPMVFHGPGDKRALQAVKVIFHSDDGDEAKRVYTFCLEKVLSGAFKDCWMVVGLRVGDYANV